MHKDIRSIWEAMPGLMMPGMSRSTGRHAIFTCQQVGDEKQLFRYSLSANRASLVRERVGNADAIPITENRLFEAYFMEEGQILPVLAHLERHGTLTTLFNEAA